MPDGELKHSLEEQPSAARIAAVESEHELVEVALEMRLVESTLVGTHQPSLR
jgi:hypothetical protein